ncbi:MAG TPA: class I SAM-dependent RNA methyltransferase [Bryobacteraceae bacterium]|nr:class I SAM-dependent RNA methyltransferase [Bryobacteraceae bacterium]
MPERTRGLLVEDGKSHRNVINIEKLIYGGAGLARVDGEVILIPYVLPGELVEIAPAERRAGVTRAELLSVGEPSPRRVLPGCEYFGRCGGCQYQHSSYGYQVEQKREILREQLRRIGKFEPPENIDVVTGPEWQYRNRIQLHIMNGRIGYLEAGSHKLCPVTHCPISSPRLNEAIGALAEMVVDRRFPPFVRSLELFTNESETQLNVLATDRPVAKHFFEWAEERIPGALARALDYPAVGFTFRVGRQSFFQVNRFLLDGLVDLATGGLEGDHVVDLYAGIGLFSLPLAKRFRAVTAVESGSGAIEDLRLNAQRANLAVVPVKASTEEFLHSIESTPDAVVADPPRAGLGKQVIAELLRLRPPALVLIACNPSTLARDLAVLLSAGFGVERITMVDLFPQTFHLETVVRLRYATGTNSATGRARMGG